MYCHINKLKKRLFYIYLLTTITKALYQPSEKGMSLLFTCPQLTEESSLAAAARMRLHTLCNFYQIESYHSSLSCGPLSMQINGTLILLYFIEMLPCTVSVTYSQPDRVIPQFLETQSIRMQVDGTLILLYYY